MFFKWNICSTARRGHYVKRMSHKQFKFQNTSIIFPSVWLRVFVGETWPETMGGIASRHSHSRLYEVLPLSKFSPLVHAVSKCFNERAGGTIISQRYLAINFSANYHPLVDWARWSMRTDGKLSNGISIIFTSRDRWGIITTLSIVDSLQFPLPLPDELHILVYSYITFPNFTRQT